MILMGRKKECQERGVEEQIIMELREKIELLADLDLTKRYKKVRGS